GIAPALAAGCTIVAKPAEQTPLTALMLAGILSEAGLPDGVLNVVTGTGREAGAPLVAHPGVDHITFTGSVATGQAVMRSAAQNVTRLVLELGGKSPVAVLADADIDAALEGVLGAIFENAGQICSAGSRLIIDKEIAEPFLDRLLARIATFRIGPGLTECDLGPVNSAEHLARIDSHVAATRRAGNRVLAGGHIATGGVTGEGWFYAPTVIVAGDSTDRLIQD